MVDPHFWYPELSLLSRFPHHPFMTFFEDLAQNVVTKQIEIQKPKWKRTTLSTKCQVAAPKLPNQSPGSIPRTSNTVGTPNEKWPMIQWKVYPESLWTSTQTNGGVAIFPLKWNALGIWMCIFRNEYFWSNVVSWRNMPPLLSFTSQMPADDILRLWMPSNET